MVENIIFNLEHIIRFNESVSFEDVIITLSDYLLSKDIVKPEYAENVILRETNFATGLPTQSYGVGIPHTDAKWVKKNSLMIGILEKPIKMVTMTTTDKIIDVSIIFMLALRESNKQLNILQKIITIIQDKNLLEDLRSKDAKSVEQIVKKVLLEG